MLWLNFDKWNHSAGRVFLMDRYYKDGYKWTPLVQVRFRRLNTLLD